MPPDPLNFSGLIAYVVILKLQLSGPHSITSYATEVYMHIHSTEVIATIQRSQQVTVGS